MIGEVIDHLNINISSNIIIAFTIIDIIIVIIIVITIINIIIFSSSSSSHYHRYYILSSHPYHHHHHHPYHHRHHYHRHYYHSYHYNLRVFPSDVLGSNISFCRAVCTANSGVPSLNDINFGELISLITSFSLLLCDEAFRFSLFSSFKVL